MMAGTALTARGVKSRLARAHVDCSSLTFTESERTFCEVDVDHIGPMQRRIVVAVTGPKDTRREDALILFDSGLGCAPFGDHDDWLP